MLRFCSVIGLCALTVAAPLDAASAKGASDVMLHAFKGDKDGAQPVAGLTADSAGNLYGTASGGGNKHYGGTVFRLAPDGKFTVLHNFRGSKEGALPEAGLVADSAGNLYGTTNGGGAKRSGTVFRLGPDGTFTVLYSFEGGEDGEYPQAGLLADSAGNLYGTAYYGGNGICSDQDGIGCGTVFKLAPDGKFTVLHAFKRSKKDGAHPAAGLIADGAGNLYGTTYYGGKTRQGTVFRLAMDGTETVLHSFRGGADGAYPSASLIADGAGNLYGTTDRGGKSGWGTTYRLAPDGAYSVLYSFKGGKDGGQPEAGLIADNAGNLYGTTNGGGSSTCGGHGCGTVFKLAPDGEETVLHAFQGGEKDGALPYASLIADGAGNLYGTTRFGGKTNDGTIFEIPAKKE